MYIALFHIFLPNQVYLIFKKVVMYKQDLKQVYKDGTIFQSFQIWDRKRILGKAKESHFIPSSVHSLAVLFWSSAKHTLAAGNELIVGAIC